MFTYVYKNIHSAIIFYYKILNMYIRILIYDHSENERINILLIMFNDDTQQKTISFYN